MHKMIGELLQGIDLKPGASDETIARVESHLSVHFPREYTDFLVYSNGGEGSVGTDAYLALWPIEDVVPLNEAYAVSEFAPGLVLFGSDGGGVGYAFDTRSVGMPIVEVPFIGMSLDSMRPCGNTFIEFLKQLRGQAQDYS